MQEIFVECKFSFVSLMIPNCRKKIEGHSRDLIAHAHYRSSWRDRKMPGAREMTLYCYFKPANSSLPDPQGLLSESMNPATVHSCNEAVKETIATVKTSSKTCTYSKLSPEQQAE